MPEPTPASISPSLSSFLPQATDQPATPSGQAQPHVTPQTQADRRERPGRMPPTQRQQQLQTQGQQPPPQPRPQAQRQLQQRPARAQAAEKANTNGGTSAHAPQAITPRPPLQIDFPESLPVSGRRLEIMDALARRQVVIVCGETGSGKTTQLPKIALAMGRGRREQVAGPDGKVRWVGKLIGHTQPRRIAATSVAKRIADELNSPLGEVAGYKVRFQDRLTPSASIKLMTDGILLAETQTDPLLRAYDTLIIDEAH